MIHRSLKKKLVAHLKMCSCGRPELDPNLTNSVKRRIAERPKRLVRKGLNRRLFDCAQFLREKKEAAVTPVRLLTIQINCRRKKARRRRAF